MQRLELIMGRNIPDNGKVTDRMMNDFIKEYIMPFFEYGTFIDGEGLWKGELEQTKIFYLELADDEVESYREMFLQIACKYHLYNMRIILALLVILCGSVIGATVVSHFSEIAEQRNERICAIEPSYCAN